MARFNAGDRAWVNYLVGATPIGYAEPRQAIALSFDATHAHCAWISTGERFSTLTGNIRRFTYWHSRKENRDKVVPVLRQVDVSYISADGKLCNYRTFWPEFDSDYECINFVSHWIEIKQPFVHGNMTSISSRLADRDSVTGGWKTG